MDTPYKNNDVKPADVAVISHTIKENWKRSNGVLVKFLKKDGTLRKMLVKLDESALAPKGEATRGAEARRETNKANMNLVVTEWLKDEGTFQVRTVPLKNVIEVSLP